MVTAEARVLGGDTRLDRPMGRRVSDRVTCIDDPADGRVVDGVRIVVNGTRDGASRRTDVGLEPKGRVTMGVRVGTVNRAEEDDGALCLRLLDRNKTRRNKLLTL